MNDARSGRLHAGGLEVAGHDARVVRECDLRLLDLRVPLLLPLETVEPTVAVAGEDLHLLLHRHLSRPTEDVAPIGARRNRVLQVAVLDPRAERLPGGGGLLMPGDEGVM